MKWSLNVKSCDDVIDLCEALVQVVIRYEVSAVGHFTWSRSSKHLVHGTQHDVCCDEDEERHNPNKRCLVASIAHATGRSVCLRHSSVDLIKDISLPGLGI